MTQNDNGLGINRWEGSAVQKPLERQNRVIAAAVFAATLLLTLTVDRTTAEASPDNPVIALSNSYYGNTWRHQMVESFEEAAKQAKQDDKIQDYIVVNGDGTTNQQMSQMADLILRKVDVIAINAASETA